MGTDPGFTVIRRVERKQLEKLQRMFGIEIADVDGKINVKNWTSVVR